MRTVPLGDLVVIKGGGTPNRDIPRYWGGDIPWASVKDFKTTEISCTQESITQDGLVNSASNLIPEGSIIVPTRMAVGKAAINVSPIAINQDLKALLPNPGIDRRFLLHHILASGEQLERRATGATVKGITLDVLRGLEINLPSLAEQRRIAAILDQADALRAKRRQTLTQLDELAEAIFIDIFGDVITNSKNWAANATLGQIAEVSSGITKGRKPIGKNLRLIPYLAVANVQDRALKLDKVKEIEATEEEIQRYLLRKNDLLLTEGGDPDKLGRGVLWNDELPECIHQNHIFRVRLCSATIEPLFLNWLVGSRRGKSYFLRSAKQTTGIASINMSQLRAFPMLIPPNTLQREFTHQMQNLSVVRRTEELSLQSIETLFASLQHRAFRGEL